MSNRVLWILIIFWFISLGVLFYLYFFVYYIWNITIKSNIEDYNISLYNKKLLKTEKINCKEKECKLSDISPFEYSLTVSKKWYLDEVLEVSVWKNETISLEVILEKEIYLNEVEINKSDFTKDEKISYLREKTKSYASFVLDNLWTFHFKEENSVLGFYKWESKLWNFEVAKKEDIKIREILWNNNYIYIELWENNYLYSLFLNKKFKVELNMKVDYIKAWLNRWEFLFITPKATFIYDSYENYLEYFSYFKDFVYLEDSYIWIIYGDDKRRLTNLWLKSNNKNLIIYYNPNTKEKKVLYITDLEIIKIYKIWEDVMFTTSDNREYKLENY